MPQIHTQTGVQSWHCMFSGFKQTYNSTHLWCALNSDSSPPFPTLGLCYGADLSPIPGQRVEASSFTQQCALWVTPCLSGFGHIFVVVFSVEWYSTVCINPSVVPHGRTLLASFNNLTKMPEVRMRRVCVASATIPTGRIKGAHLLCKDQNPASKRTVPSPSCHPWGLWLVHITASIWHRQWSGWAGSNGGVAVSHSLH